MFLSRGMGWAAVALAAVLLAPAGSAWAAGDANDASCPNEGLPGFRTYLPDCRGYELVSPPYEAGFPISEVVAISADGEHLIAKSFGAFAGNESNVGEGETAGTRYELSRSGSGWTASPLSPPATQFPFSELLDIWSGNFSRTLWDLHSAAQPVDGSDYYIREADGSFALVGPPVPPSATAGPASPVLFEGESGIYNYEGASRDLSHILFSIPSKSTVNAPSFLWPGDTTYGPTVEHSGGSSHPSLYEYFGTCGGAAECASAEPKLVGVENPGPLRSDTEAQLISRCGTVLGSSAFSGSAYNAVSASGSNVFFTAIGEDDENCGESQPPVDEVFARVEDGARTVAISEPSEADCTSCNTTSGLEDANFQGASEDGTKAFFMTEQALLHGNQGKNIYEYDFDNEAAQRIVLVSGGDATVSSPEANVKGVARVSADGSHVYFVADGVLTKNPNSEGESAKEDEGQENLYLYERDAQFPEGRTVFIGMVRPPGEVCDKSARTEEVCEEDEKLWKQAAHGPSQTTPDGRFLVFESSVDLTPGDTSSVRQVFEYDAQTGTAGSLTRVSIGQNGFNNNGNTDAAAEEPTIAQQSYGSTVDYVSSAAEGLTVSEDGSYVIFSSADALTPQATGRHQSIYEYHDGTVYLVSDGRDTAFVEDGERRLIGLDASGSDVFFRSADQLVPQATDTQESLYDARIAGGFPAPAAPAGCVAESCQGPLSAPPLLTSAGSVTQSGGENVVPKPETKSAVKPKAKALTGAQKLAKARKACRKRPRKKRAGCESQARKKYGGSSKAKQSTRRGA
jgi:hypothetical protein